MIDTISWILNLGFSAVVATIVVEHINRYRTLK